MKFTFVDMAPKLDENADYKYDSCLRSLFVRNGIFRRRQWCGKRFMALSWVVFHLDGRNKFQTVYLCDFETFLSTYYTNKICSTRENEYILLGIAFQQVFVGSSLSTPCAFYVNADNMGLTDNQLALYCKSKLFYYKTAPLDSWKHCYILKLSFLSHDTTISIAA